MDQHLRGPVVAALIHLAGSDDYRDRADAGCALAAFAGAAESRDPLLRLVLDGRDTFVTRVTAEALLRRLDTAGFMIVAEALGAADSQHQTHIHDAVVAVFMVFASERDRAVDACDALSLDASEHVRRGAGELREMLTEIRPLLFPQESG